MSSCYLLLITRNQWHDYELITDLPDSFGEQSLELKRQVKSFFPLDFVDTGIVAGEKLVSYDLHLQTWTGKIGSFHLPDIQIEQIGRPIMLGVGIIQLLDSRSSFIRYQLDELKEFLPGLIAMYQTDKSYSKEIIEVLSLGCSGEISVYSAQQGLNKLHVPDYQVAMAGDRGISEEQVEHLDSFDNVSVPALVSRSDRDAWLDDSLYLWDQTKRILNLFSRYPSVANSSHIKKWLSTATRKCSKLSRTDSSKDWKKLYECMLDSWQMPLPKRTLFINPKLIFMSRPQNSISARHRDILDRQVDNLFRYTEEEAVALADIENCFDQLEDTFQEILLHMVD